jgi:hypothetical protein
LIDEDLHFHDLRGTAVTRLALSGCTVPEIAAITGHSPRDVGAILEAHNLGGRVELAEQAILKLDRGTEAERKLQTDVQTGLSVLFLPSAKCLILLSGAHNSNLGSGD